MKSLLPFFLLLFFFFSANSQSRSFSLLKFRIPAAWEQQIKSHSETYDGMEPETNKWMEIRVFEANESSLKPDSSFRQLWHSLYTGEENAVVPPLKRRYTESGLLVYNNANLTTTYTEGNRKMVSQLILVVVGKQTQAFQLFAENDKDLKMLRPFIDSFIDSIDTIVKQKD